MTPCVAGRFGRFYNSFWYNTSLMIEIAIAIQHEDFLLTKRCVRRGGCARSLSRRISTLRQAQGGAAQWPAGRCALCTVPCALRLKQSGNQSESENPHAACVEFITLQA